MISNFQCSAGSLSKKKTSLKLLFKKLKFEIDFIDFYIHKNLRIIPFGSMNQKL